MDVLKRLIKEKYLSYSKGTEADDILLMGSEKWSNMIKYLHDVNIVRTSSTTYGFNLITEEQIIKYLNKNKGTNGRQNVKTKYYIPRTK